MMATQVEGEMAEFLLCLALKHLDVDVVVAMLILEVAEEVQAP